MRKAPLTDRQKTEKGLYGSYASRVRGRAVTAQSKEGSWTRRKGGAAMKSKNAFGSAKLVLVAALFGVVGLAVPPAGAKPPKIVLNGCTMEQVQSPEGRKCDAKSTQDLLAGRAIHQVVCTISGMYCCQKGEDGRLTNCEKISAVRSPGGLRAPQGGVIGPVVPSQPRVAPVKPPVGPLQKSP